MPIQRLRVKYGRSGELQYIAHLDMLRLWQRLLRRAEVPVAFSSGHMARPRLSIAAALPVGVTSDCELLDVYLKRRVSPFYFLKQVGQQAPTTLQLHSAEDVPLEAPSLQSQVRSAEYRVGVETETDLATLELSVQNFLHKETFPWEHQRDKEVRRYDLRPLVLGMMIEGRQDACVVLSMHLRADPSASGRPEQVVAALGLPVPAWVHRIRLLLAEPQRLVPAGR